MTGKIKFSFLMPCWNGENYVKEAIDSVIAQTYENWELVFIDNGSTDDTDRIIDEYAKMDLRIKPIHIEHVDTVSKSRNSGIDYLSGDYTQLLDSDDYISPDLLEKCYNKICKSGCDIVLSDVISFNIEKNEKKMFSGFLGDYEKKIDGKTAFYYSIDWQIHGWMCVKTEILKEIRFETSNFIGDEYSTRVMLSQGQKIGFVDSVYYYRYNPLSTGKNPKNVIKKMTMINNYKKLYDYCIYRHYDEKCLEKIVRACYTMLISFYLQFLTYSKLENDEVLKKSVFFFFREAYHLCFCNKELISPNRQKFILLVSFNSFFMFKIYLKLFKLIKGL